LTILREIRQRQGAERALQRANLLLEARVKEQLQALSSTTEELQLENIRRAKAEEAERRQREWWSVTLTSIGDAVITTDTQGRINYLNQTAPATDRLDAGRSPGATAGQSFSHRSMKRLSNRWKIRWTRCCAKAGR
jgi:PAS domain-containing protein